MSKETEDNQVNDESQEEDARKGKSPADGPVSSEPGEDDPTGGRPNAGEPDNGKTDREEPDMDEPDDKDSTHDKSLGEGAGNGDAGNGDHNAEPAGDDGRSRLTRLLPVLLIVGAVIVVLAILINTLAIGEGEPTPEPTSDTEQVGIEVEEPAPEEQAEPSPDYPPDEFFVANQVIVSGPAVTVETAIGNVERATFTQEDRLAFGQLLEVGQCPGLSDRADAAGPDLVTDLYTITPTDEAALAEIINEIEQNGAGKVTAEPNRIGGSPWEVEGSPWEVEGSPWEVEGGSADVVLTSADPDAWMDQWAFQIDAIDLPEDRWPEGAGIMVGVFDTLPFSTVSTTETVPVSWVTEPKAFELTPLRPAKDTELPPGEKDTSPNMINHGLFVAGLVHAVAPDSSIELIRVLDEDNRGDLFTLNKAIFDFLQRMPDSESTGAVINLSLGIRIPPLDAPGFTGLDQEVHSLRDLLALARCSNVVVVAAAGNNSAKVSPPELPNLPAAWSSVIGVAASNSANGRSCFSNLGDIGAPGGDGRETDGSTEICRPRNHECKGPACSFSVVGPISQTTPPATGFAFWSGSSFAAPIVSGLAARVLEAGNGSFTPADVRAIIECGATESTDRYLGAGVINVRRTIDECIASYSPSAAE